jgi:UDP-N-acetylglucosamine--N-acetylmuramyl-(pentapeptide) pyrophosphoryl-undecaprenol N-acetylglucosamine transferase
MLNRDLASRGRKLYVIHQTGVKDEAEVTQTYAAAGVLARVQAFEHEMGRAFATADIVVARAGASTCFELALTGKPAFLIPLPSALRNHQHYNAAAFAAKQAAAEGRQDELAPRALANWLLHKAENRYSLAEMARRMNAMGMPDAAAKVADLVERVAKR